MPGFQELLVIGLVALLVFGPDRLPELARSAGRALARFRAMTQTNLEELKRLSEVQELEQELQGLRKELRATRGEVLGRRGVAVEGGSRPSRSADGSVAAPQRAEDDPPPVDLEAT